MITVVSVDVEGLDEVVNKLSEKFSERKLAKVENDALRLSGRLTAVKLKQAVSSYRDTGATVIEIVAGKPRLRDAGRTINVGWNGDGSKQRWRLVHLNEWGYTRNGKSYRPRGVGKVQQAYEDVKQPAIDLTKKELEKLL